MKYLNIGLKFCLIYLLGCTSNPRYDNEIEQIRNFFKDEFQHDYSRTLQIAKIDSIIKLKNGNYFVVVNKKFENDSSSDTGIFDFLEVGKNGSNVFIKNSIYGSADSALGSGLNNLSYQIAYLNNSDYLLLVNKNITDHGNYDLLNIILNSRIKLFETYLTDDYSGMTYGTQFSELVQIDSNNGIMKKILFRCLTVSPTTKDGVLNLNKKYFEISNSDIDLKLNKINKIKSLKEVNEKSQ